MKAISLIIIITAILLVWCDGKRTVKLGAAITNSDRGTPQFGRLLAAMSEQGR